MLKKNIKRIDIVNNLNLSLGLSSSFSKKLINDLVEIIINNIKSGNLHLKDIGSFKVISKKERVGRNPKTKNEYIISARKSVSFTVSKKISNKLNEVFE